MLTLSSKGSYRVESNQSINQWRILEIKSNAETGQLSTTESVIPV